MDFKIKTEIKEEVEEQYGEERTYDNVHFSYPTDPYFSGLVFKMTEADVGAPPSMAETDDDSNFKEIWEELSVIVENELPKGGRKKRGIKQRKQSEYDKIINGLIVRSERTGFSDEELLLIWKLLSHPASKINCTQRRKLAFSMLPKKKVGDGIIKLIVDWLRNALVNKFKPSVVVGVYQLLNLYAMYKIVEVNGLSNEETLTGLLVPRTENFVIPWKMHLFRTIVTPSSLKREHIIALNKLEDSKDAKKVHIDDVLDTIGICKHMRPDLFRNANPLPYKFRNLNFPKEVLPRFYKCLLRITEDASKVYHHPWADRIFPEFLPDSYRTGKFAKKNILETVLECTDTSRGIAKIARTPVLFECFQQWLQLIIRHRFENVDKLHSVEDFKRYCFIFQTCTAMTKRNLEAVPVLSKWVCDVVAAWDFWAFRGFVIGLIPFIMHDHVVARKQALRETLVNRFIHCPWLRFEIWCALENLCYNWMNKFETNSTGIEWTIDLLDAFVSCLVFALEQYKYRCLEPSISSPLKVEHICKHYIEMQKKCSKMALPNGTLRTKMLHLPDALMAVVLNDCPNNPNVLRILSELITRRDDNLATFQLKEDEPDAYTECLPFIHDGTIVNQMDELMNKGEVEEEDVLYSLEGGVCSQRPMQSQQN